MLYKFLQAKVYDQVIVQGLVTAMGINNNLMSHSQQNKQGEQPKRTSHLKFLSIKSILRNKKVVVKKSVPSSSFYSRNDNTYSTYELVQRKQFPKEQLTTHRGYNLNKNPTAVNTNIVTIKFGEQSQSAHKTSDHKLRKKFTNTFNVFADQTKRSTFPVKERSQIGPVEETLIIEPLQKLQSHFGWDKRKGFFNYMLITRNNKKQKSEHLPGHETMSNIRHFGKQLTQTQFTNKKRSYSRPNRTSTSFLPVTANQGHGATSHLEKSSGMDLESHKQAKTMTVQKYSNLAQEQIEKLEKAKQKQANEAIIKQFRDILPLRKPTMRKDYFVFGMTEKPMQPENKIQLYRDFLWKINYSNSLYVLTPETSQFTYKAYVGTGNNSCMVKSILRRRSWWSLVQSSQVQSCNFVWTQLKLNSFFKGQSNRSEETRAIYQFTENIQDQEQIQPKSQQDQLNEIAHRKIFNARDLSHWAHHLSRHSKTQQKITQQTHIKRLKLYTKKQIKKLLDSQKLKIHNHLQYNFFLGNKKALFYNIKRLCEFRNENPFQYIPVTFHISKGMDDPVFENFMTHYKNLEQLKRIDKNFRNIWICKPGENTNRGNGISVCSGLDDVRHRLRGKQKNSDGKPRSFILQKYIEKPFLYKNRKFDIRHYILLSCINGIIKAYWFEEGYVRTSSSPFTLKNSNDLMVHLTNDAVQKKGDTYGKHEKGNKVSYEDFQKYLDTTYKKKYDFLGQTLQKMKSIAIVAVQATYSLLDPNRKQHNFQLIGLDFMIDQNFKPWLIEANTNPCLELSSPLLQKLIPSVVEQTFKICIDPLFPPPENCSIKNKFFGQNALLQNRYELIFDESVDGQKIRKLFKEKQKTGQLSVFNELIGKVEEDNELFEDDGNENWQQKQKNTN